MSDEYGSMAARPSIDDKEADTKESPSNDPAGAADGDKDEEIARLGPVSLVPMLHLNLTLQELFQGLELATIMLLLSKLWSKINLWISH